MLRVTITALLCAAASALSIPTVASKPLQHSHFSTPPSSPTIHSSSALRSSKVQLDLEPLKTRTQNVPESAEPASDPQSVTEWCHNMALQRSSINNANVNFSI